MERHIELIERVDWQYSLYKIEGGYELVIHLTQPSPGFDVIHDLTEEEIAGYGSEGIAFLGDRMADMKANHTSYKLHSWR